MAKAAPVQVRRVYDPPKSDDGRRVSIGSGRGGSARSGLASTTGAGRSRPSQSCECGRAMILTDTPSSPAIVLSSAIQSAPPRSPIFASWRSRTARPVDRLVGWCAARDDRRVSLLHRGDQRAGRRLSPHQGSADPAA
jgi:hypothetical protein